MKNTAIEQYITRQEAAEFLKVSLRHFDNLRAIMKIRSYRFGKCVRFKLSEINQAALMQRVS